MNGESKSLTKVLLSLRLKVDLDFTTSMFIAKISRRGLEKPNRANCYQRDDNNPRKAGR